MSLQKILHISNCDKFIPPFIELTKEHFDFDQHKFLLSRGMADKNLKSYINVYLSGKNRFSRLKHYIKTIIGMHKADKIILHGLFDIKLVILLFFMPYLLKKCYWVMWGGDLYYHQLGINDKHYKIKERIRGFVIKRIGHFVTYIKGDYHLAQQWYGATGKYHECIMYTSNTFTDYNLPPKQDQSTNILIGNSADPSNNHEEILAKLTPYKNEDIKIFCPLSYGNPDHAKQVIEKGKAIFGEKFIALTDFMPFDEYLILLSNIDIAIFAHKRQQAMGNTISLLGLGKKVYLRSDVTQWQTLSDMGVKIFDIDHLVSNSYQEFQKNDNTKSNPEIIKSYFNKDTLKQQLNKIFEDQ